MDTEIKAMIVVGTEEQIRENKGELALTFTEAAGVMGVSESGLRALLKLGKLNLKPVIKIGKANYYRVSDVERAARER